MKKFCCFSFAVFALTVSQSFAVLARADTPAAAASATANHSPSAAVEPPKTALSAAEDSKQADPEEDTRSSIAVPMMKARGVDDDTAQSLNDLVVQELTRVGLFRVISMSEIMQMIEHDRLKTALGCDDESCLAEIGGALGVDMLVSGSLSKIGQTYILNLKLIDVGNVKVINREERSIKGDDEKLIEQTRMATQVLVRPLLDQAAGYLKLSCSEEGAEVSIDEVLRGTTPLKKIKIPGGYHKLMLSKKGFIAYAKDVKIESKKTQKLDVRLMPSPDFVEAYESKASAFRMLAWTFSGVSAASLLATAGILGYNLFLLNNYNEYQAAHPDDIKGLNAQIDTVNSLATAALATGLVVPVAGTTAAVFWIIGDEPGKYARMLDEEGE